MKIVINVKNLAVLLLFLFFGGLFWSVTIGSPIAFGDEGYYAVTAKWIVENAKLPFYEPYRETLALKQPFLTPPMFPLTEVIPFMLLGGLGIKIILPLISLLSAAVIYVFFKKSGDRNAGIAAAAIFLSTPSLVTHTVLNYVDALSVLFLLCASYFTLSAFNGGRKVHSAIAGVFLGFALLTKATGPILVAALVAYFVFSKNLKQIKTLITVLVVGTLVFSPFLIKNTMLHGGACYSFVPISLSKSACAPFIDEKIKADETGLNFVGRAPEAGTEAGILKIGIMNYVNFAFGLFTTALLLFGIASTVVRRKPKELFFLIWLVVLIPVFQFGVGGRAEDLARYTLSVVIPISILSGLFLSELFNTIKKYNKYIAIAVMFIIFVPLITGSLEKINAMFVMKSFAPGFFDGCDWIKQNTPKSAVLLSLHTHPTTFNCERNSVWEIPDKASVLLTNNDTSYEHLKLHGINYVYVQLFSLSLDPYGQAYPLKFVQYVDSSPKFKRVYDNSKTYGNSGVLIYEVL